MDQSSMGLANGLAVQSEWVGPLWVESMAASLAFKRANFLSTLSITGFLKAMEEAPINKGNPR